MSVRIEYTPGNKPTTRQILDSLNAQHPDKVFTAGPGNVIVESYRESASPLSRAEALQEQVDLRALREAKVGYGATEAVSAF